MKIQEQLKKGYQAFRKAVEIPETARVLFLYKSPAEGYQERGAVTDYFFLEFDEDKDGKSIAWLKILNTPANRTCLAASNNLIFQNFNPLFDCKIFNLNKQIEVPPSQIVIRQQINPTMQPYPPLV